MARTSLPRNYHSAEEVLPKFQNLQHALYHERRQCDALRHSLSMLLKEREEADLEQRQLRDLDPSVQEARHAAERRMKDLEQGTTKLEAVLSKLRQRKMALMKEINVVRSQKEEMAHACQRLAQENQGLQLTLQNVAAKIEVVHADRLASDSHKQLLQEESRAIEDEIESLSRKLHQARTLALSSVNAAGKKMAVELV